MQKIEELFDERRDLHRTIEKVITFGVDQEERLGHEIREYVVTPHMEEAFESLLSKMQLAMQNGGAEEIGVWVSGFYGSGKSSFTKYLGLALDESVQIEGEPFLKHLQNRFNKQTTKSLLARIANAYPATVVFLDLASDQLAGGTMEDISTVLFYKVLEHAGFSRNLKVAALERRIQKDGRMDEFRQLVVDEFGVEWEMIQNDLLAVDDMIPALAHKIYPNLFSTPTSFSTKDTDVVQFETDRVAEMLEIIREFSGKENVIFIIDEVGQYVASNQHLILNLDGLARNLKGMGDGKVWIMGTAQQTLTEDDPRAAINSPELYRLKDRFPIRVDLKSSDIRQICYQRLLKKSVAGQAALTELFENHGQSLRHATSLENAKFYSADFDAATFTDLYPFLPSHFDILLQLLGSLAKTTGGIGLRSAIKVIQDILIEGPEDQDPTCQQPVGWLATMVTVFDVMEQDIEVASPNIYAAYKKVNIRFPNSEIHIGIGKTVALLQILNNIPITNKNVAALLHCSIAGSSKLDEIDAAINELINDTMVPFDYRESQLCFLSERLSEIQKTRGEIPPRSVETRRIFNSVIKEVFDPLPSRKIFDSLTVTAGIKTRSGTQESALAGERNSIQLIVDFVTGDNLESRKTELEDESRTNAGRNNIYIIGKKSDDFDKAVNEIYRSEEISRRFRNDTDEEVRSYCNSQNDRAAEETRKLKSAIEKSLYEGMFIFRAAETAVDSEGSRLAESCKKFLGEEVADSVFDKYEQAPVRVDTGVAESFLRNDNLSSMTAKHDPLGLVQEEGGTWNIDIDHPAINSIRDYLQSQGSLEGKQLSNKFTAVPYGWSQDTLRYLIAAMLYASELKIKVGGNWILSPGQKAIDSLKNNNAFKNVMVSLRDSKPNPADLAKAAQRLTELTGNHILPLEQDIAKAAAKFFASVQNEYGALAERLKNLKLPCADSIEDVCNRMSESIQADCSDAVTRLGAGDETFEKLKLAASLKTAFSNGLDKTISTLHLTMERIQDLPDAGPAGQLKKDTEEDIQNLKTRISAEDFFEHGPEYASALTSLENAIGETAKQLAADQIENIEQAKKSLTQMPDWPFLNQQRKSEILGQLDVFRLPADPSYEGVKRQLDARYEMTEKLNELRKLVVPPKPSEPKTPGSKPEKLKDKLILPAKLKSLDDFSNLNQSVQAAQHKARTHAEFEIEIELKE